MGNSEFVQLKLKQSKLFLLFEFLRRRNFHARIDGFGLIWTRASIHVTCLDVDVGFLAQFLQIVSQGGLQLLHVESVLHFRFNFFEWRNARHLVIGDFQNNETLLGPNNIGKIAGLEREGYILEFLGERAAFEIA